MALPHAQPGEVIELRTVAPTGTGTKTLFKTPAMEVLELILSKGKTIAEHQAPGELIVQCIRGRADLIAMGKRIELGERKLCYLAAREPHAVEALENSSLLVTILFPAGAAAK